MTKETCCESIDDYKATGIWKNVMTTSFACYSGHLDCLKYAHENGCFWDIKTTLYAVVYGGRLDCLKYAHENGCPWHPYATAAAAEGYLDCLKYAHENGCPWHIKTTLYAVMYRGGLDCLKYAHENGCEFHPYTIAEAAKGHLDCLKYAHENGYPWNINTTLEAALGHLDCLKYAHENGCPWHKLTSSYATKHIDCFKYAIDNGCALRLDHDEYDDTFLRLERSDLVIDLDDKWWRHFLFNKDVSFYSRLSTLVNEKKQEIKECQEGSGLLNKYMAKDVIQYILWSYF